MKHIFAKALSTQIEVLSIDEIFQLIEYPKHEGQGDLSFPVFTLSKHLKQAPNQIAQSIAEQLHDPLIERVEAVGGYVNVYFNQTYLGQLQIKRILQKGRHYGDSDMGHGQVITMDVSSPNIAKPFSMGHLRSTVIGNSIALIAEKLGYSPVKINHLGDWGTQFGKLIVAYKLWGNEADVKKDPIPELFKLYVKFHEEAEKKPELDEQGREAFLKLEQGDEVHVALWEWFRSVSLDAFNKIYDRLGVTFDSYHGEAFYNDKMDEIVELLASQHLLVEDNGAQIVKLEGMPPALIKKNNGSTLYITRDLATALYRKRTYNFDHSYYVVGNEQSLHFKQLIEVLKLLGFTWAKEMQHIPFGMILKDGKKMSTRKGKVILLNEVLDEAVRMAKQNILEKSTYVDDIDKVAEQIGIGAVIFNDLKNDRLNDIEFNIEEMLKAEGNTCLYLQYTNARIHALIDKSRIEQVDTVNTIDAAAWPMIKQLHLFESTLITAFEKHSPAEVARYLLQLARYFNQYYNTVRILDDETKLKDRIALLSAVSIILEEGLRLLGIQAPKSI